MLITEADYKTKGLEIGSISTEDVINYVMDRDAIWAAAVQAYRAGQSWEFSTGELAALSDYQSDFMEIDAWADTILSSVSKSKEVTTANILLNTIGVGLDKQNTSHRRRVAAVRKVLPSELDQDFRARTSLESKVGLNFEEEREL